MLAAAFHPEIRTKTKKFVLYCLLASNCTSKTGWGKWRCLVIPSPDAKSTNRNVFTRKLVCKIMSLSGLKLYYFRGTGRMQTRRMHLRQYKIRQRFPEVFSNLRAGFSCITSINELTRASLTVTIQVFARIAAVLNLPTAKFTHF
jgi:hypothetical protein